MTKQFEPLNPNDANDIASAQEANQIMDFTRSILEDHLIELIWEEVDQSGGCGWSERKGDECEVDGSFNMRGIARKVLEEIAKQ